MVGLEMEAATLEAGTSASLWEMATPFLMAATETAYRLKVNMHVHEWLGGTLFWAKPENL